MALEPKELVWHSGEMANGDDEVRILRDYTVLMQLQAERQPVGKQSDGNTLVYYTESRFPQATSETDHVDGTAWYSGTDTESSLVDSQGPFAWAYDKLYDFAIERLMGELRSRPVTLSPTDRNNLIGEVLLDVVRIALPWNHDKLKILNKQIGLDNGFNKLPKGSEVDLGVYLELGIGVCRQQAQAVGITLEKLMDAGLAEGTLFLNRSQISIGDDTRGHAWLRWEISEDIVLIIDPAQNYFGPVADLTDIGGWNYLNERDYERLAEQQEALDRTIEFDTDQLRQMRPDDTIDFGPPPAPTGPAVSF